LCSQAVDIYGTKDIQSRVMKLYTLMLKFLADVLDWYDDKWYRKLLKSFNEDVYKDFEGQVLAIRQLAQTIKNQVITVAQSAEIRSTRLISEDTNDQVYSLQYSQKKVLDEIEFVREDDRRLERLLLASQEEQWRRNAELAQDLRLCYQRTLEYNAEQDLLSRKRLTGASTGAERPDLASSSGQMQGETPLPSGRRSSIQCCYSRLLT
jgi:hypothetical protein